MSALDWEASAMIAAQAYRAPVITEVTTANDTPTSQAEIEEKKRRLAMLKREIIAETQAKEHKSNGSQATPRTDQSAHVPSPKPLPAALPIHSPTTDLHPRPSSPGLHSPASSLIFERSVQESTLSPDAATGIPAHLKTDDQIPPALEASSLVITDSHLGPEEVEIVTHASHQPAAAIIAESISSPNTSEAHLPISPQESGHGIAPAHGHEDDNTSTYGSLDPNDVRRLSFISFADVVHAEHAEAGTGVAPLPHHHEPSHAHSPTTRSPMSSFSQPASQGVTTPPTSISGHGSMKNVELSPTRGQAASAAGQQHGELAIETLGQALRKPVSRDLSGFARSPPSSAT